MRPPSTRISHVLLYSGCGAGVLAFAIITMGGTVWEDSSQNRFLGAVGSNFAEIAFALILYAAPAVYAGRRGVLAQEAEAERKKE